MDSMEALFLFGRIMFGGFFLIMGLNHFLRGKEILKHVESKNVPFPNLAVVGGGALLVFGGGSMVLGLATEIGAMALVLFLAPSALMMHDFWNAKNKTEMATEMSQFMKSMALLGAAIMTLMIEIPWAASVYGV